MGVTFGWLVTGLSSFCLLGQLLAKSVKRQIKLDTMPMDNIFFPDFLMQGRQNLRSAYLNLLSVFSSVTSHFLTRSAPVLI